MKKSLALLLCLLLVLTVAPISAQDSPLAGAVVMYVSSNGAIVNGTDVKIDDDFTVTPYVENGTTLIPLRFLAQSLGCEVEWNGETQTAVLTRGENVISVTVASDVMDVNGNAVSLGAAAAIRSDRTFVPLRAICEALGKLCFTTGG